MPLVQAKCTNCGANLQVDNTKDAAICPYCGSAYIVEKAINNYNVTNNIQAGVVNVFGGNSADFVIRAGTLEKYNGAATEVVIPANVKEIGFQVFEGLGITHITIPEGIESIKAGAFRNCNQLREIHFPNSIKSLDVDAFRGCAMLKEITVPSSIVALPRGVFSDCTSLRQVNLSDGLTYIGEKAFGYCTSLESINIPNTVEHIVSNSDESYSSFYHCFSLISVTLPFDAESIIRVPVEILNSNEQINKKLDIVRAFMGTPWYKRLDEAYQIEWRKSTGRCLYCGNRISIITGRCKHCGRAKSY